MAPRGPGRTGEAAETWPALTGPRLDHAEAHGVPRPRPGPTATCPIARRTDGGCARSRSSISTRRVPGDRYGAPGGIRTPDPQIRRKMVVSDRRFERIYDFRDGFLGQGFSRGGSEVGRRAELLHGEELDALSRELGVTAATLGQLLLERARTAEAASGGTGRPASCQLWEVPRSTVYERRGEPAVPCSLRRSAGRSRPGRTRRGFLGEGQGLGAAAPGRRAGWARRGCSVKPGGGQEGRIAPQV